MKHLERQGITTAREKPKKKQKYKNRHTWVDGICFHSQKEADRYGELQLLLMTGEIIGFCRQPEFVLIEGDEKDRAITYSADFIVFYPDGTVEIEDTKGYEPEQWKRTWKMFRHKYPGLCCWRYNSGQLSG